MCIRDSLNILKLIGARERYIKRIHIKIQEIYTIIQIQNNMVRFMESLLLLVILFVEINEAFLGGGHGKRESSSLTSSSSSEAKKFFEESKVLEVYFQKKKLSIFRKKNTLV